MQEGHDLSASTGVIRRKSVATDPRGYAVCDCPFDRFIVEGVRRNVAEAHVRADNRLACRAPQEGDDLTAGTLAVRVEAIIADTRGDVVCNRPLNRLIVVCGAGNVNKTHSVVIRGIFLSTASTAAIFIIMSGTCTHIVVFIAIATRTGMYSVPHLIAVCWYRYNLIITVNMIKIFRFVVDRCIF